MFMKQETSHFTKNLSRNTQ